MLTIQRINPGEPPVWHPDLLQVLEAADVRTDGYESPAEVADDLVLLAVDEGRVLGVAVGHPTTTPFDDSFGRFGRFASLPVPQAWLDVIAVLPTARRRGAGRLLVRVFADIMSSRGCTHVVLKVDQATSWEARVAFFESCGFSLLEGGDDDLRGAEITTLLEACRRP
ncbi:GNAT family N-acetyltransferase [Amycolatopsis sp. NPDC059021]|uniref:GNAT family N-acetyltransferase n=1 Tax=Amycolatopsis sp. NPDC059021 TaxID=3346704 RepID=UPI003672FC05